MAKAGKSISKDKGFTLVEIMVAMGVVLILIVVSQAALFGVQKQRRASSAKNNFMALVREARASALLLGAASGTPRVTTAFAGQPGQCPGLFEDPLTGGFRAGLQINMNEIPGGWTTNLASNAEGHNVTYVSQIVRSTPVSVGGVPQLPEYQILCKSVNFPQAYRNAVIFNRSLAEGLTGGRLTLTFDSRGFIDSAGPGALDDGVITVPMRENEEGSSLARSHRDENILVFASGFACIESGTGTLACRD